jgi:hypothetical protein
LYCATILKFSKAETQKLITEKNNSKKLLKRLLKESEEFIETKSEKQKVDKGKDDLLKEVEILRLTLRAKDAEVNGFVYK